MGKRAKNLYEVVYEMVKKIPKGKVATYGQIARLCGLCEHARLVGYALYNLKPGSSVPWHRVVNSKGMISLPEHTGAYEQQKSLLQRDGVLFKDEKIDLAKHGFGYSPEGPLRERRRKQQRGPEEARPR